MKSNGQKKTMQAKKLIISEVYQLFKVENLHCQQLTCGIKTIVFVGIICEDCEDAKLIIKLYHLYEKTLKNKSPGISERKFHCQMKMSILKKPLKIMSNQ